MKKVEIMKPVGDRIGIWIANEPGDKSLVVNLSTGDTDTSARQTETVSVFLPCTAEELTSALKKYNELRLLTLKGEIAKAEKEDL